MEALAEDNSVMKIVSDRGLSFELDESAVALIRRVASQPALNQKLLPALFSHLDRDGSTIFGIGRFQPEHVHGNDFILIGSHRIWLSLPSEATRALENRKLLMSGTSFVLATD
jgi:hypothetical protein